MIRLFYAADGRLGPRAVRLSALGALVLATAVSVAACGGSSTSSSSTSGTSQGSTFRKCLEAHGVTPPPDGSGFGGGGTGASPRPRPTGSGASSFRQAIQACGGSPGSRAGSAG